MIEERITASCCEHQTSVMKLMDSPSNTELTWLLCASAILLPTGSIGTGFLPGSTPVMRFFPLRRLPYPQKGMKFRAI